MTDVMLVHATAVAIDFGDGGRKVIDVSGTDTANGVAITPIGSVVVVGDAASSGQIAVAQLLPSGKFDPAFHGGSAVSITARI